MFGHKQNASGKGFPKQTLNPLYSTLVELVQRFTSESWTEKARRTNTNTRVFQKKLIFENLCCKRLFPLYDPKKWHRQKFSKKV